MSPFLFTLVLVSTSFAVANCVCLLFVDGQVARSGFLGKSWVWKIKTTLLKNMNLRGKLYFSVGSLLNVTHFTYKSSYKPLLKGMVFLLTEGSTGRF